MLISQHSSRRVRQLYLGCSRPTLCHSQAWFMDKDLTELGIAMLNTSYRQGPYSAPTLSRMPRHRLIKPSFWIGYLGSTSRMLTCPCRMSGRPKDPKDNNGNDTDYEDETTTSRLP